MLFHEVGKQLCALINIYMYSKRNIGGHWFYSQLTKPVDNMEAICENKYCNKIKIICWQTQKHYFDIIL